MRFLLRQSTVRDQLALYVFVFVLFVVGIVFGVLLVSALTLDQQQNLAGDIYQFVQRLLAGNDTEYMFSERFFFHFKWMMLIWLLGLTVVGMPLVLALDFLKGVLVGFAVGTIVYQYEWKGLLFSLVSVAPPNLLVVPMVLITSAAAISFSLYVIRNRLLGRMGSLRPPFVTYVSTAAVMLIVVLAAAAVEMYLSPFLLKWAAPLLVAEGSGL
ncbi:stage II sporulation protein M [Paenibacillus sp. GCM10027626]|uniref:stage II sporulation protein M n=1 Tax=Paenibacillus sp. GCM10027626 TaxID=3273411 RepID=UPI0036393F59